MDIRILPSNIANMIAAGEVVQRPASVVKELMENAVDAGASRINVIIQDAGRTLIQVIDDGCGMDPDQAVLCFERHATSKIASAADLEAIATYGFRGEALPSIAAVASVTLRTRRHEDELGVQVTITDATAETPGLQDVKVVSTPVGSNFAVRNLFYNTPARRKFLKSDATELKAIISEFLRVALTRDDIAFSLSSNGRDIYRIGPAQARQWRIRDLFGESVTAELMPLEVGTSAAAISGFIAKPDTARKTISNQFFFVNGRYFRSPYLHKAVMKAYENLLPEGCSPSYFIYLDVDPRSVDINVHPTKTEIKFEDDNVLFNILMAAVREGLGRNACDERIDFEGNTLPTLHAIGASFEEYKGVCEPATSQDASFNPFDNDGFPNETAWKERTSAGAPVRDSAFREGSGNSGAASREGGFRWYDSHPGIRSTGDCSALFDSHSADGSQAAGPAAQVHGSAINAPAPSNAMISGRYIVMQSRSGMMLVDSSRAMQRLLYERFIEALSKEAPVAQTSLFPIEVEVGAENMPLLTENAALLQRLGFEFEPFSTGSIAVNALPEGLTGDKVAVAALVYEVLTALSDEQASLAGALYSPLAQKLACSAARTAQLPTTPEMARTLTDRLFQCENPEFTPDGHRTVTVLKNEDLEKLLK